MQFEEIFQIHVVVDTAAILNLSGDKSVTMIPFSGSARGKYFTGKILPGGIDTQTTVSDGTVLSARYMLEGTDIDGRNCKIYIENNGSINAASASGEPLFKTQPKFITNSKALDFLHHELLVSEGIPSAEGVTITIFRVKNNSH